MRRIACTLQLGIHIPPIRPGDASADSGPSDRQAVAIMAQRPLRNRTSSRPSPRKWSAPLKHREERTVVRFVPPTVLPDANTPVRCRSVAVYGPLVEADERNVRAAASAIGIEALFFDNPASLSTELETRLPIAVLVGVECEGSQEVCAYLRGRVRYATTPLLGLTGDRTDLAFGTFYGCGGDDLVSVRGLRPLVSRLRMLTEKTAAAPIPSTGAVIVATSQLAWRNVVTRTLSNVGLEPRVVGNGPDATDASCGSALFVLASDELPPDGATAAFARARARGSATPWVIAASPKSMAAIRQSLEGYDLVTVVDRFMPADNLLFTANQLRETQIDDLRIDPRGLFGTVVAFRPAGGADDDHGFTYNVSRGGMFVRTLARVSPDEAVWFELWPPHTERTVRLVGHVAWQRSFGPHESATVPPGFGVKLTGGLPGDIAVWEASCQRLIADRPGPLSRKDIGARLSTAPPPWPPKAIV